MACFIEVGSDSVSHQVHLALCSPFHPEADSTRTSQLVVVATCAGLFVNVTTIVVNSKVNGGENQRKLWEW